MQGRRKNCGAEPAGKNEPQRAVIINGIDDQVHAELNGKEGMYNNISRMSEKYELAKLCKKLMTSGFDVYITSDHGNTLCTGMGRMTKAGVETETKGHRMVVLNQLGDKNRIKEKYGLIEYPKYYLDKDNDYLVCKHGTSLDNNGDVVMSHGGISIDEVVVPFIKMKAGI